MDGTSQQESITFFTPLSYRCPACDVTAPMLVDFPHWFCTNAKCKTRLIPADIYPRRLPEYPRPASERRLDLQHASVPAPVSPAPARNAVS